MAKAQGKAQGCSRNYVPRCDCKMEICSHMNSLRQKLMGQLGTSYLIVLFEKDDSRYFWLEFFGTALRTRDAYVGLSVHTPRVHETLTLSSFWQLDATRDGIYFCQAVDSPHPGL